MNTRSSSLARPLFFSLLGSGFLILLFIANCEAQGTRSISNTARRLDEFNRQAQKAERDDLDREMRGRKPSDEEHRHHEIVKAQIKEDFETLQTLYNEIVSKLRSGEPFTSENTSEISTKLVKSSERLKANIALPEKKTDKTAPDSEHTPTDMRASFKHLGRQLYEFLTNPVFETGVLDVIEVEKARNALDQILHTCRSLNHGAAKGH